MSVHRVLVALEVLLARRQQNLIVLVKAATFVDVWYDELQLYVYVVHLRLLRAAAVAVVRLVREGRVVEHLIKVATLVHVTDLNESVNALRLIIQLIVADFYGGDPHIPVLEELTQLVFGHLDGQVLHHEEFGLYLSEDDVVLIQASWIVQRGMVVHAWHFLVEEPVQLRNLLFVVLVFVGLSLRIRYRGSLLGLQSLHGLSRYDLLILGCLIYGLRGDFDLLFVGHLALFDLNLEIAKAYRVLRCAVA